MQKQSAYAAKRDVDASRWCDKACQPAPLRDGSAGKQLEQMPASALVAEPRFQGIGQPAYGRVFLVRVAGLKDPDHLPMIVIQLKAFLRCALAGHIARPSFGCIGKRVIALILAGRVEDGFHDVICFTHGFSTFLLRQLLLV